MEEPAERWATRCLWSTACARNCKCFLAIVTDNGQDSYFSRPMCRDEIKWAQAAERTIVPVCGVDDKQSIMALINGGKECGVDFSSYNMVDIDRSAPRRLKASLEDILEQAGMLEAGMLKALVPSRLLPTLPPQSRRGGASDAASSPAAASADAPTHCGRLPLACRRSTGVGVAACRCRSHG